jgi:OsmC-like protein.
LSSDAVGEVEKEEGVLVIRRIHVRLNLKAPPAERETAENVHASYQDRCPLYRTLKSAITITTELVFKPLA